MEGEPSTFTFIPGMGTQAQGQALSWGSLGPFSSKCNIIQNVMITSHVHWGPNSPVVIKPPCLVKGEDSSDQCRYAYLRWPSQTTFTINVEKQVLLKHSSEQLKVDIQKQSDLCAQGIHVILHCLWRKASLLAQTQMSMFCVFELVAETWCLLWHTSPPALNTEASPFYFMATGTTW